MPDLQAAIHDIAVKAFEGYYGDNPFGVDTEGYERMFSDAWERIGQYDQDSWCADDNNLIMDAIRDDYDIMARAEAIENLPESIRGAWEIEAMEEEAAKHPPIPMSIDDIILKSDNLGRDLTILDKQNEYRVANGDKPIYLNNSTIDALAGQGIDASRFKDPYAPPLTVPVSIPMEAAIVPDVEGEYQATAYDEVSEDMPAYDGTVPMVEQSSQMEAYTPMQQEAHVEPESGFEGKGANDEATVPEQALPDNMEVVLDDEGTPIDLVFRDPDNADNEVKLSDVLKDLTDQDPEYFKDVFSNAIELAEQGEDYKTYLSDAIEKYAIEHTEISKDVEKEDVSDKGSEKVTVDENTIKDDKYQKRYDDYTEKIKDARDKYVPLRGDSIDAFNQMARVYNAYKGDIEINGRVPNVVDVAVSAMNFMRSNPIETILIHALRFAIDELKAKDVEKEAKPEGVEKEQSVNQEPPVDKEGFRENGTIDHNPSDQSIGSVDVARKGNPLAAKSFGADMSQVDKNSTPSVVVRTTNPDGIQGRGVQVTLDNADKFVFPDVRLVELKGCNMLVSPFGKIMEVLDDTDKYKVGQQLGGKLDVSETKKGSEALDTFANEHGISRDEAKNAITAECKERFCTRIEASYKVEVQAIENHVIPRELETKTEINSAIATIERLEHISDAPIDKETLSKTKEDLVSARTTLDGKIMDLGNRTKELEKSDKKGAARSLNERFADAVASEKKAIGRSIFTVDIGVDRKSIDDMKQKGVAFIREKVSAYNADKPEMDRISYDSKTGALVDRYGITDKGVYVGNKYGPFMADGVTGPEAMTKEDTDKYIEAHFDPSRFDTEKIFPDDTKTDVENNGIEEKVEREAADDDAEGKVEREADEKDVDAAHVDAEETDGERADVEQDPNKDLETDQRDDDDSKQSQREVETNAENAIDNEKAAETDPTKPETDPTENEKNDTERKEDDRSDVDQEKTDVEQGPVDSDGAQNDITADNNDPIESDANAEDAQEGSVGNDDASAQVENEPDDQQQVEVPDQESIADSDKAASDDTSDNDTEAVVEDDEANDVTAKEDEDDETPTDGVTEDETDGDEVDADEGEKDADGAAAGGTDIQEADIDDDMEAIADDEDDAQVTPGDVDVDESISNVSDEPGKEQDDTDIEEKSSNDISGDDEGSDGEGEKVDARSAIEGENGIVSDDDEEAKDSIERKTEEDDNGKEDDSILDQIGDWADKFFEDLDLILSSPDDFIEACIGGKLAEIEELKDFLCEIKDAETMGDAIEIIADRMADTIANTIEAEIDRWEGIFDLAQDVFETLVDAFGPENGLDLVNEMMHDFASADIPDEIRSEAFNVADEILPTHTDAPESIEVDGMEITPDGLFDAFTGDDIGFNSDAQMETFGTDIENEIQNSIENTFNDNIEITQDQLEMLKPDIADIDTPLDFDMPDCDIDGDFDAGIDNEAPEANVEVPEIGELTEVSEVADAIEAIAGLI